MSAFLDLILLGLLALILVQTAVYFEFITLALNQLLYITCTVGIVGMVLQAIRIIGRSATDESVTKLWSNGNDNRIPELILSALELDEQRSASPLNETTQKLIGHQLDYVFNQLSLPDREPTMPVLWTRRRGLLLGTVLCVLTPSLTAKNFWTNETRAPQTQMTRSWIKGLKLTLTPPTYTKLPSRVLENTDGNIETLLGSKVAGEASH